MTVSNVADHAKLMAIRSRLLRLEAETLSPSEAKAILQTRLDPVDLDRMHGLAIKNQDGTILPHERGELEHLRQVGYLIDLIHSRARRALQSV